MIVLGLTGTAAAGVPSNATPVPVAQGQVTNGVDASLQDAATLSGRVTTPGGAPIEGASVDAYLNDAQFSRAGTRTDSHGHYRLTGLLAGDYVVCVRGDFPFGGGSSTRYVSRCYQDVAWFPVTVTSREDFNGDGPPASGAEPISVQVGQHVTGINLSLPAAAAISGTVRSKQGPLRGVVVYVFNRSNRHIYFGITGKHGKFTVVGLPSAPKGYAVCADPLLASLPKGVSEPITGFRPRCHKDSAWRGARLDPDYERLPASLPSSAAKVAVRLGHTRTGVNITVPKAGAISGTVRDATTKKPIDGSFVVHAFTSDGFEVSSASTNSAGHYVLKDLATARADRVCVDPGLPFTPRPTTYAGLCWRHAPYQWAGEPSKGAAGIKVVVGKTHKGIDLAVRPEPSPASAPSGTISGQVTDAATGNPIYRAAVTVFHPGQENQIGLLAGSLETDHSGNFKVKLAPSAQGYVVCVWENFFNAEANSAAPSTGWAPQCYQDKAWDGGNQPSSDATALPLADGQDRTGVNFALQVGGAIHGTVTQSDGTTAAKGVRVQLYTADHRRLPLSFDDAADDGTYELKGLSPGNYVVCFDGQDGLSDHPGGYQSECYDNVVWDGRDD